MQLLVTGQEEPDELFPELHHEGWLKAFADKLGRQRDECARRPVPPPRQPVQSFQDSDVIVFDEGFDIPALRRRRRAGINLAHLEEMLRGIEQNREP